MGKQYVTVRFKPNTKKNLRTLIEYLQDCEKELSTNEDTEICIVCNVEKANYSVIISHLATDIDYNPNKKYDVVGNEVLVLSGVLDELDDNNQWVRIFPLPINP